MSDNTQLNAATTVGDVIATDDVSNVKYQRVKLDIGGDGVSSPVIAGNGIPAVAAGDVAHDGADSGNPLKIGYQALAVGSSPTAVSAGDRTNGYANVHGIPFVQPGHPNIVTIRATYTSAQTNAAIVSVGAGNKIVITRCSAALGNDVTTSPSVIIGFAAATTPTTTGVLLSHPAMFAGQHISEGNGAGILGIGADAEDVRITTGTITTGSLDVVLSYYILPI